MSEKAAVIKGHGHVTPNADGYLARCGGPTICKVCKAELAALKAQPSGVVQWPDADEIMQMAFEEGQPGDDASGYYFELEEFDLFIQRLMEEVGRLNSSPVSDGDERAGWTEKKPTEEGAYWIRGNGLEADALVQVKQKEGELWCNLHMRNSEPDFEYGYTIEQLSSEFEWLGPLQARAALSAPSHGEQVRDVAESGVQSFIKELTRLGHCVISVDDLSALIADRDALQKARSALASEDWRESLESAALMLEAHSPGSGSVESYAAQDIRAMLAAAPSAGSQGGDV